MPQKKDSNKFEKILLIAEEITKPGSNVVFIIGAGASASAKIPTASQLKEQLFQLGVKEDLDAIIKQKEPTLNVQKASLEMLFSAYRDYTHDEDAVYKFLLMFLLKYDISRPGDVNNKIKTPLAYEILAHLISHGLIKYIISMNFDELLERALDDEVGIDNYEKVIGRPDFKRLLDIKLLGKLPHIIFKPHGTISLSATLKPTWESVTVLDPYEKKVFDEILQDSWVIFVGYSFSDRDMQRLFLALAAEQKIKKVCVVDGNPELKNNNEKISALLNLTKGSFIQMKSDYFFRKLAKAIFEPKQFYKEELKNNNKFEINVKTINDNGKFYQNVYRHRIRDILFECGIPTSLEYQFLIELIIYGIKARGKFKGKVLTNCGRIRHYYQELIEQEDEMRPKEILDYLVKNKFFVPDSMNLRGFDFEKAYYCPGSSENDMAKRLISKLSKINLTEKVKLKMNNRINSKLTKLMKALATDFDYDFGKEIPFAFSFKKPTLIKTHREFGQTTEKILGNSSSLKIIAETGEWLTKTYKDLLTGRLESPEAINKIQLIISDPSDEPRYSFHRRRAQNVYNRLLEISIQYPKRLNIRTIPWETKKHHMTIGDEQCIYFFREGKSSYITPIILMDRGDIQNITNYFDTLWSTAKSSSTQ